MCVHVCVGVCMPGHVCAADVHVHVYTYVFTDSPVVMQFFLY